MAHNPATDAEMVLHHRLLLTVDASREAHTTTVVLPGMIDVRIITTTETHHQSALLAISHHHQMAYDTLSHPAPTPHLVT